MEEASFCCRDISVRSISLPDLSCKRTVAFVSPFFEEVAPGIRNFTLRTIIGMTSSVVRVADSPFSSVHCIFSPVRAFSCALTIRMAAHFSPSPLIMSGRVISLFVSITGLEGIINLASTLPKRPGVNINSFIPFCIRKGISV